VYCLQALPRSLLLNISSGRRRRFLSGKFFGMSVGRVGGLLLGPIEGVFKLFIGLPYHLFKSFILKYPEMAIKTFWFPLISYVANWLLAALHASGVF